jgi:Ca2+-binding EF-hand superfamily protein
MKCVDQRDEKVHHVQLKSMLDKYDADGSGNLDADELTQLLAHYDNGIKSEWNEITQIRSSKTLAVSIPLLTRYHG